MTIRIRETMAQEVAEGGSALLSFKLIDELGAPVFFASLTTLQLTLTNLRTGAIINSKNGTDIKNANGGTVGATDGKCTLALTPADNPIVEPTRRSEWHVAFIKGTFNSGAGVVEKLIVFKVVNTP